MSRVHLTFGIIFIFLVAISGMATKLVSIGEGIIIILIILISWPFLNNILKRTKKHDER